MILSRPFYNPSTSYLMGLLTLKGQDYIRFYFVRTENNIPTYTAKSQHFDFIILSTNYF